MESYTTEDILNNIIREGFIARASDIHIDPTESSLIISFRVDGWLRIYKELNISFHEGIILRVKVLARLALDDKRLPKDGRFRWKSKDGKINIEVRVSMVPTIFGENAVLRLFDQEDSFFSLRELGLSEEQVFSIEQALELNSGIVIVVGATGSGKTTTLYSMISHLKKSSRLIITIEDPVERQIKNIRQIEVGGSTLLDFSTVLRSILRQDPDIIMVGEIRDGISAGLALQAALTGHLVLTTLHASSTVDVRNRLINMGVSTYLLDSLKLFIISQKLVSKTEGVGRTLICELSNA